LKKALNFFSYLFHPLFIPLFTVLCFFRTDQNYLGFPGKILFTIQVVILTILIPIALFFLFRTMGKIKTVMAAEIEERKWPLLAQAALLYVLLRQDFTFEQVPELYYFFLSGIILSLAALLLLYAKIKVSLHMAGLSSMLFFIIGLSIHDQQNYLYLIAGILVVSGFVASSRLQMEAHSNRELVIGFLCGMVSQASLWYFWL
jgi:hypothetical protein